MALEGSQRRGQSAASGGAMFATADVGDGLAARSADGPPAVMRSADAAIFAALAARDPRRAFALVHARYGPDLDRRAARIARDPILAEDIRQDALAQIFRDLVTVRAGSDLRAWVMTVVTHRALDELKKRRRRARWQLELDELPEAVAAGPDPATTVGDAEEWRVLEPDLQRLPPAARLAVMLHFGRGRSFHEIAREVGQPADAVRTRVSRALVRLRRALARRGIERAG